MTDPHGIDPTGAHGVRPDAGQRTDLPAIPVSEHRNHGGLLRAGTRVRVLHLAALTPGFVGEIVDQAAVPAPYLSLQLDDGTRTVVFTGPGVVVQPAPPGPAHPGLGPT